MTPDKIEKVYIMNEEFFDSPNDFYLFLRDLEQDHQKSNGKFNLEILQSRINAIEKLISSSKNKEFITIGQYFIANNLLNIGMFLQRVDYLKNAKIFYLKLDRKELSKFINRHDLLYRMGKCYLYIHLFLKFEKIDKGEEINYFLSAKKYVIRSQNFLQTAYKEVILEEKIENKNLKTAILLELVLVSAELNRWTEFHYYLEQIPVEERGANYYALRVQNLSNYLDSSHCDVYPSLIAEIIKAANVARKFSQLNEVNKSALERIIQNKKAMLNRYPSKDHLLQIKHKHNKYRYFCLENNLALNEHSLYCHCKQAKYDNLKLRTNHPHTHHEWLLRFDRLIDQLKFEYNQARFSYYTSQSEKVNPKGLYNSTVIFSDKNSLKDIGAKSRFLIQAFKQAYSILDKIASGIIPIYPELTDIKEVYFYELSNNLEKRLDLDRNKYLVSIYSLGTELNPNDKLASINEYRLWRNAIEHNYFFLEENEKDRLRFQTLYEDIDKITFENAKTFQKKTLHLLQLCKSAIFSFVFLLRQESCQRFFNHRNE